MAPIFLAGIALNALYTLMFPTRDVGGDYFALLGASLVPLAIATLVVSNLAVLRSRRGGTAELCAAVAAPAHGRTLAHLLALAWPTAIAAAFGSRPPSPGWAPGMGSTSPVRDASPRPGAATSRWVHSPSPRSGRSASRWRAGSRIRPLRWSHRSPCFPAVAVHDVEPAGERRLVSAARQPAQNGGADASWPCAADQPWPCILEGFATALAPRVPRRARRAARCRGAAARRAPPRRSAGHRSRLAGRSLSVFRVRPASVGCPLRGMACCDSAIRGIPCRGEIGTTGSLRRRADRSDSGQTADPCLSSVPGCTTRRDGEHDGCAGAARARRRAGAARPPVVDGELLAVWSLVYANRLDEAVHHFDLLLDEGRRRGNRAAAEGIASPASCSSVRTLRRG